MKRILILLLLVAAATLATAQTSTSSDMASCPMHAQHMAQAGQNAGQNAQHPNHDRASGVDSRGDKAMGFSHEATTHHFWLKEDGGVIQVTANDPDDHASVEQIRMHLSHIATAFGQGDFDIPMFVHDEVPPGVQVMKQQRAALKYNFEKIANGGQVVIRTANPQALAAVHDFLRYQITDHRTGDPVQLP